MIFAIIKQPYKKSNCLWLTLDLFSIHSLFLAEVFSAAFVFVHYSSSSFGNHSDCLPYKPQTGIFSVVAPTQSDDAQL